MHKLTAASVTILCTFCLMFSSTPAFANEECVDYAQPIATAARLLAISINTTADALVAINKRANENEITSFNDFVDSANNRAKSMSLSLQRKEREIMRRAEETDDYTLCKQDLTNALEDLREETNKAKALLVELKQSIKDILEQLKGAFFG